MNTNLAKAQAATAVKADPSAEQVMASYSTFLASTPFEEYGDEAIHMTLKVGPSSLHEANPTIKVGDLVIYLVCGMVHKIGGVTAYQRQAAHDQVDVVLLPVSGGHEPSAELQTELQAHAKKGASRPVTMQYYDDDYKGSWQRLDASQARVVRASLGAYVPKKILRTFWSPAEQAHLKAQTKANARHASRFAALAEL